jgi:hypothetical protein
MVLQDLFLKEEMAQFGPPLENMHFSKKEMECVKDAKEWGALNIIIIAARINQLVTHTDTIT